MTIEIFEVDTGIHSGRHLTEGTFVQKLFNNDQMTIQNLLAYGTEGEWWISPMFKWETTQNTTFSLGAQIFEGNHYDTLGQFNRNDQIFTRFRYSF